MFCTKCGTTISGRSMYCTVCGTQNVSFREMGSYTQQVVASPTVVTSKVPYPVIAPKPRKLFWPIKLMIVLTIIISILIGGLFGYSRLFVKGPDDVMQTLVECVEKKDLRGVINCMDSRTQRLMSGFMGMMSFFSGGLGGPSDLDWVIDAYPLISADGTSEKINITFTVKYSGGPFEKWNIDWLNKLFAKEAYLTVNEPGYEESGFDNAHLINEGFGKWRIVAEDM